MKAGVLAVAAALAAGVSASKPNARHAHAAFHERDLYLTAGTAPAPQETDCGCVTKYSTVTGEGTLIFPPVPVPTTYASNFTSSAAPSPSTTSKPYVSTVYPSPVVPTPMATTCPTPGIYTIPATTVTLTESTTVCGAASTHLPAGNHTYGGVTTVVSTSTTVVCPYATTSTYSGGVVTSTILTTTYVCPAAGTYTIAPFTTAITKPGDCVYPTVASYAPGTYTQDQVVTTVTETDYVVVCPFTSPAPVQPTSTSVPAPVKPTSTYVPAPPAETYVASPPAKTYEQASTPAYSSAQSTPTTSSGSSGGELGTSGDQWAMTYTPYQDNGQCKDAGSVSADIAVIAKAGFSSVRVYSSDCNGLENIGAACEANGLKMILGIFISSTGIAGATSELADVVAWGQWDLVEVFVVGNEAIFNGYVSGPELAAFIVTCKTTMKAGGYHGLITTTEPLNIWQENTGSLCDVVDVVGANIHPFFNADVDAGSAGEFTASQLKIVDSLCPGKYGVNLETGWPSSGECNGMACPGTSEQVTAVKGIAAAIGGKSVMFSFTNDYWKAPGAFDCEQSWGSISIFE